MSEDQKFKAFAVTTCEALRETVDNALKRMQHTESKEEHVFNDGYLCALHRVITLIQQQAELYEINLEELSIANLFEADFAADKLKID